MDAIEPLERCLAALGQDGFAPVFLAALEGLGADQVMVFAYRGEAVSCLLSQNFAEGRLGARLAAAYLQDGFRDDPLRAQVLALAPGAVALVGWPAIRAALPEAYRARFFDAPGLGDKAAVLAVGDDLRLIVNLYRAESGAEWPAPALRALARIAVLHFERRLAHRRPGGVPEPLMALSERERAVCLGVLGGRKAEEIAHDLGVAPTSVVTYRKRAYAKLGISSRAGLFALCRG